MTPDERRAALLAAEAAGAEQEFLPFYGHKPQPDGRVGPGCLSQWWQDEFTVDGVTYATAEHWMMAGKARLFGDDEALADALAAASPGDAKAVGRRVRGFDPDAWAAARYGLVVEGNLAKFGQHPDLADFLRSTGSAVIVEASPRDRIWGVGLGPSNPDARRPSAWRGLNLLGFALMDVRERLSG